MMHSINLLVERSGQKRKKKNREEIKYIYERAGRGDQNKKIDKGNQMECAIKVDLVTQKLEIGRW